MASGLGRTGETVERSLPSQPPRDWDLSLGARGADHVSSDFLWSSYGVLALLSYRDLQYACQDREGCVICTIGTASIVT